MKKNNTIGKIFLGIIGVILIIVSLVELVSNVPYVFSSPKDIDEIIADGEYVDDYENKYVSVYIDFALDKYARTDHKRYAITTGTDYHYGILLLDDSIISVDVSSKNESAMNQIVDDTWDYLDYKRDNLTSNPLELKEKIKKLGSDLSGYYKELLEDFGVLDSDYEIHYYTIDTTSSPLMDSLIAVLILAVGAFMLYSVMSDIVKGKEKGVDMMGDGGQDGY